MSSSGERSEVRERVLSRELGPKLCELFGIDPKGIRSISIACTSAYGEVATVTVERWASLTRDATFVQAYELVKKDSL